MAENYASSIAPKPYIAAADGTPVDSAFRGSVRPLPAGITLPDVSLLNSFERAELHRYLANPGPATLATLRRPDAITAAEAWRDILEDPEYQAWVASTKLDQIGQWKNAVGSATAANASAVPASLAADGIGTAPAEPILEPEPSEPDAVEDVEASIASGTLGSAITLSLSTATGGATIHWRKNGGTWINYSGPVAMAASDILDFYATAPGLANSSTDSFQNS